jgi:DNA-binding PadR family transcriptional regulator
MDYGHRAPDRAGRRRSPDLNQGTLYPALLRLEQQGWISSAWGVSENDRRARFHKLTAAGRRHLEKEASAWHRMTALVHRFLEDEADAVAHRRRAALDIAP